MKKLVLIVCIFSSLAFTTKVLLNNTNILISPASELYIKGKTNVNTFKCEFNIKQLDKPIPLYYKAVDDKIVFEKAQMVLSTNCFDCGNRAMNKDFMNLLKSDEHPEILLELKEINRKTAPIVKATVQLSIAGTSKTYCLPLELKEGDDIRVSGTLKLNITDFGLDAPKKALGLIVVSEDIEIKLQLILEEYKN